MLKIALVMIVKNEAEKLKRCLESIKPWVDEMYVLDTGSTDQTIQIAESCGAKVGHFTWVDDFSKARNAALEMSDADWNLILDADEWLISGGEALDSLREVKQVFIGLLKREDIYEMAGQTEKSSAWISRILPRGAKYEYRIHEQPIFSGTRRQLPILLGHDGYLASRMEDKAGRNEALLRAELNLHPEDIYLNYQLGKELEISERFSEAVGYYEIALLGVDGQAAWKHDLVIRALYSMKRADKFEAAVQLAETEMPNWQHSPDFYFVLGDLLLDWAIAEPIQADALLPIIESSWQRCLEIGENPVLNDTVSGRGSFLAAKNLHAYYSSLGQDKEAAHYAELEQVLRNKA